MKQAVIQRAAALIQGNIDSGKRHCVLALIDHDGAPTASVISPARAEGIRWVTFCTGLSWNKPPRIAKCDRASVCFGTADYSITLVGRIEVITDAGVKAEMWYPGLERHFSGHDDPNYCVLRFTTQRYNILVDAGEAAGVL